MFCKCIIQKGSDKVVKYTTVDSTTASRILAWQFPADTKKAYESILCKQFKGYDGYAVKKVSVRDSVEVPYAVRAEMQCHKYITEMNCCNRYSNDERVESTFTDIISGKRGEASIQPIENLFDRIETLKSLYVCDFTDKDKNYTPWMNILIDLKDLIQYEVNMIRNGADPHHTSEHTDDHIINISRLVDVPQEIFTEKFIPYREDNQMIIANFTIELFYKEEDM